MSKSLRLAALFLLAAASIPITVAVTPTAAGAASDEFTLSSDQLADLMDACQESDLQPRTGSGHVVTTDNAKPRTEQRVSDCWRLQKTTRCIKSLIYPDLYNCTIERRVEAETVTVDSIADLGCDPVAFHWNDPVLTCTDYTDWAADCYPVADELVCIIYRPQEDVSDSVVAIYPDWTAGPKPFLPIFW